MPNRPRKYGDDEASPAQFQGQDASCSGDAVTSKNKSVVVTAGRCVKYEGSFHKNWIFVPGYHDGKRPYGTWTSKKLIYCNGTAFDEPLGQSNDQGLNCTQTGGASGGPWLMKFSKSKDTGLQNSVNSFKYTFYRARCSARTSARRPPRCTSARRPADRDRRWPWPRAPADEVS